MTSTGSGGEAMDEAAQFLKSFSDSKQSTAEWLSMLEKRLDQDEFQLTFLPVLEDKLEASKVSFLESALTTHHTDYNQFCFLKNRIYKTIYAINV
jgi:hypothetical protein